MANQNYAFINGRPPDRNGGIVDDPFSRKRFPKRFECPACKRQFKAFGGSCPDCADKRDTFVMIVEVF